MYPDVDYTSGGLLDYPWDETMPDVAKSTLTRSSACLRRYTVLARNGYLPPVSAAWIDREISSLDRLAMENQELVPEVIVLAMDWLRLKALRKRLLH